MKLKDKVAIVTGGSRGIGKTIAEFFAREGARVAVLVRDKNEIKKALKDIAVFAKNDPMGFVCDVSDETAVRKTVAKIGKRFRRVDVLVNAAGIQAPIGLFVSNDMREWTKNIQINLLGTVYACHAVIPFMKKHGGSIINFSGGGATSSRPNFSAYAAAKIGVVKLTEILADELAPLRIRVNAVAPGAVNTKMLAEVLRAGARAGRTELTSARKRAKEGGVPPELAASLVVFLASNDSRGLSGRLVSAPWDDWKHWDKKKIEEIMKGDKLKLRRA